ncbi:polycomb group protein EMBRYONIC FLOWER 2 [Artemisia annua]|uniref:Polycomb group protein EMBRYONIC FLOWER 2 n=1 Tax=Artemisia annua TaxID=35608 RepID=A0A2U1L5K7_ARTAN|nr:polycomb group protein EMBRYONIC FLOWER 2 [Artemisia annua]
MAELKLYNSAAFDWSMKIPADQWSRSHFSGQPVRVKVVQVKLVVLVNRIKEQDKLLVRGIPQVKLVFLVNKVKDQDKMLVKVMPQVKQLWMDEFERMVLICISLSSSRSTKKLPRNPAESSLPVVQLSAEQERAAQQSLKVYCQPIKYYNILHDRALDKPLDLQRCLHYKVRIAKEGNWQRSGNVTFNFKCYNDMCQMNEVMEDYSCAIRLIKCASFKGLKCHLRALHDLTFVPLIKAPIAFNGLTCLEAQGIDIFGMLHRRYLIEFLRKRFNSITASKHFTRKLDFESEPWFTITDNAKDLLRKMRDRNPKKKFVMANGARGCDVC